MPCADATEPFSIERLDLSSPIGLRAKMLVDVLTERRGDSRPERGSCSELQFFTKALESSSREYQEIEEGIVPARRVSNFDVFNT